MKTPTPSTQQRPMIITSLVSMVSRLFIVLTIFAGCLPQSKFSTDGVRHSRSLDRMPGVQDQQVSFSPTAETSTDLDELVQFLCPFEVQRGRRLDAAVRTLQAELPSKMEKLRAARDSAEQNSGSRPES